MLAWTKKNTMQRAMRTVLEWPQSHTTSKHYKYVLKSDCKQPLRIGIIRALNECTGRLFRATTRHNHKSSDMQSKTISKDQELSAHSVT